jgi:hypothetical protein
MGEGCRSDGNSVPETRCAPEQYVLHKQAQLMIFATPHAPEPYPRSAWQRHRLGFDACDNPGTGCKWSG